MKKALLPILALCLAAALLLAGCDGSDYKAATSKMESGDYAGAREAFSALGDYQDSAAKVTECDYLLASAYLADGKYTEAADLFEALGSYEDSADKRKECDYLLASAYLTDGKYTEASALFEALGSYKDSADLRKECDYQIADAQLADGKYDEAAALFEALGDYKDSADKRTECTYQKALTLLNGSDYEGAGQLFAALGDYKDSAEKAEACTYQQAVALYEAGSFADALQLFMTVPTYEGADRYCVLCYLQADPDGFVDLFVAGVNTLYGTAGLPLSLQEEIVPYERDARSFYADLVPDRREILLCFNCDDANGSSHADGQINNITVIGDTYYESDIETVYAELLYTAIFSGCVLDDRTMNDPAPFTQLVDNSFLKVVGDFTGKEDYQRSESFDYNGYQCTAGVIFWPGNDGIYRFIFSITIPELVN